MQRIRVTNAPEQSVGINNQAAQEIGIGNAYKITVAVEPYEGAYQATPSQQTQVFQTNNKRMTANFVVNPIPRNYGLITYNGFELTVS